MPGGGSRSDYIALPSEVPGQLYLEEEDGPFNSRKPSLRESQTRLLSVQLDLTSCDSRKPLVLVRLHKRNMLFRPLHGSLHQRRIPSPLHTEVPPDYGSPKADQHLFESGQGPQKRFGEVHSHRQLRIRRASAPER